MSSSAVELFGRHLDLAPLRGRRHGVVACIFHKDKTPSLSVDLERGVFHCFGCGTEGGLKVFAERVGAVPASPLRARRHGVQETEPERARRNVFEREARLAQKRAEWAPLFLVSDFIGHRRRLVEQARVAAGELGDTPKAWAVLELAVNVEREALNVEGELDAILAEGRIT